MVVAVIAAVVVVLIAVVIVVLVLVDYYYQAPIDLAQGFNLDHLAPNCQPLDGPLTLPVLPSDSGSFRDPRCAVQRRHCPFRGPIATAIRSERCCN